MLSVAARRVSAQAASPPQKANFRDSAFFDVQRLLDSAGIARKIAKFRNKERIFVQGDAARNVRYIQEGGVKLTVVNEAGKEAVVAILGPGDFFWRGLSSWPDRLHGHGDRDCNHVCARD